MLERNKDWYQKRLNKIEKQEALKIKRTENEVKKGLAKLKKKKWKLYFNEVWKITESQDLLSIKDIEKRSFFEYQLDHIVSVYDGFKHNIPAEMIGHISNLRITTTEYNCRVKGIKSEPEELKVMLEKIKNM